MVGIQVPGTESGRECEVHVPLELYKISKCSEYGVLRSESRISQGTSSGANVGKGQENGAKTRFSAKAKKRKKPVTKLVTNWYQLGNITSLSALEANHRLRSPYTTCLGLKPGDP